MELIFSVCDGFINSIPNDILVKISCMYSVCSEKGMVMTLNIGNFKQSRKSSKT